MKPALTRHDFERIAAALADLFAVSQTATQAPTRADASRLLGQAHHSAVRSIAAVLARANARFDAGKFTAQATGASPIPTSSVAGVTQKGVTK